MDRVHRSARIGSAATRAARQARAVTIGAIVVRWSMVPTFYVGV